MNTETGEVRQMTADEAARLNEEAKRELWKMLPQLEEQVQAELSEDLHKPYEAGYPLTRAQRRLLHRKANNGASAFEMPEPPCDRRESALGMNYEL